MNVLKCSFKIFKTSMDFSCLGCLIFPYSILHSEFIYPQIFGVGLDLLQSAEKRRDSEYIIMPCGVEQNQQY